MDSCITPLFMLFNLKKLIITIYTFILRTWSIFLQAIIFSFARDFCHVIIPQ